MANLIRLGTNNILMSHLQNISFHKNPLLNQFLILFSGTFIMSSTDYINGLISPARIANIIKRGSIGFYLTSKKIILRTKEIKTKTYIINSIVSNSKDDNDNTLYTAVAWYIDSERELSNKDKLEAYTTDNISEMKFRNKNNILTKVDANLIDTIKFDKNGKKYVIEYSSSSNVKEFHKGDKIKKEDNPFITLTYKYTDPEEDTLEILKDFSNFCLEKYAIFRNPESKALKKWTIKTGTDNNSYHNDFWNKSNLNNKRTYDSIILKEGIIEEFQGDLKHFIGSQEEYYKLGLQYARGYLFHGPPGCGKTSLIKAVANHLHRDIIILNLSLVNNADHLDKLFQNIKFDTVIIVIEDIDSMTDLVKKREEKKKEDSQSEETKSKEDIDIDDNYGGRNNNKKKVKIEQTLTFGDILNFFSGVNDYDGRITFFTTNHPEKLDEALQRSGRIDRRFELGLCDKSQIKRFYQLIYKEEISDNILGLFDADKYAPANIVNYFFRYKNEDNHDELIRKNLTKFDEEIKPK